MTKDRGFTLVELTVVVALFGVLVLAATNAFLELVGSANRAKTLNEVRQNAGLALAYLNRRLRTAHCAQVVDTPTCAGSAGSTLILYEDPTCVTQSVRFDVVSSLGKNYLIQDEDYNKKITADFVTVDDLCFSGPSAGPIKISLTLSSAPAASARAEFKGQITLTESVVLRNY